MKIQPVKKYETPAYPNENNYTPSTKGQMPFLSHKAVFLAMLTLFLQNNSKADTSTLPKASQQLVENKNKNMSKRQNNVKTPQYDCAPVFDHGDGRGAIGCVVQSPPVFITEADAQKIIIEMFSQYGIKFSDTDKTFKDLSFITYQKNINRETGKSRYANVPDRKKPLNLNLFSEKSNLGIVYVTKDNYDKFWSSTQNRSTVSSFDTKFVARQLVPQLDSYGKFTCGVFYDPLTKSMDKAEDDQNKRDKISKSLEKLERKYPKDLQNLYNQYFMDSEKNNFKEDKNKIQEYYQKKKEIMLAYEKQKQILNDQLFGSSYSNRQLSYEKTYKLALENLQAQVNDFIVWLKEKKIITEGKN